MTNAAVHPVSSSSKKPSASADILLDLALASLDDDQAIDVVPISLNGKSSLADHMVIASGRSTRHVAAMAQKLEQKAKAAGHGVRVEGLPNADWVLVDMNDVIVHLFRPEVRSFYNLERMWSFDAQEGAPGDADPNHTTKRGNA